MTSFWPLVMKMLNPSHCIVGPAKIPALAGANFINTRQYFLFADQYIGEIQKLAFPCPHVLSPSAYSVSLGLSYCSFNVCRALRSVWQCPCVHCIQKLPTHILQRADRDLIVVACYLLKQLASEQLNQARASADYLVAGSDFLFVLKEL